MSESIPMNAGHLAQALAAPIARKRSRWHLLRTQGVLVALVLLIIFLAPRATTTFWARITCCPCCATTACSG